MKIVALDFETYYDKDYSLSKMPTAAYIRDPRFEVIGLSMKVGDGPVQWITGTKHEMREWLPETTWWHDAVVIGHNNVFDSTILQHHFGIRPRMLACTMSMAATLGMRNLAGSLSLAKLADWFREHTDPTLPRKGDEVVRALGLRRADFTSEQMAAYGEYCRTDTEISRRLFDIMLPLLPADEMRWHDVVLRMHTEPTFILDKALLEQDLERVLERKASLLGTLAEVLECDVESVRAHLASNDKFAEVLTAMGVTPPTKISQTTGKETWAFAKTDNGMIELSEHPNTLVQAVVAARLGTKSTIEETRLEKLIGLSKIGPFALPYRISGAHTLRLAGSDGSNVQNMPSGRIKGQSNAMRRSIMAPPGHTIIASDSKQIEARVLAWLAGQNDLLETFAAGGDPYKVMASAIYNVPAKAVEPLQRQVGKAAVLGAGFGMGAVRFRDHAKVSAGVDLAESEAEHVIDTYRRTNSRIVEFWRACDRVLRHMIEGGSGAFGGPTGALLRYDGRHTQFGVQVPTIFLPNGTNLYYPELRIEQRIQDGKGRDQIAYTTLRGRSLVPSFMFGGKCSENLTQSVAFALMKWQALQIGKRYPVKLNTHDEHCIVVPNRLVSAATEWVTECMSRGPSWAEGLPLACDVSHADRYGDC